MAQASCELESASTPCLPCAASWEPPCQWTCWSPRAGAERHVGTDVPARSALEHAPPRECRRGSARRRRCRPWLHARSPGARRARRRGPTQQRRRGCRLRRLVGRPGARLTDGSASRPRRRAAGSQLRAGPGDGSASRRLGRVGRRGLAGGVGAGATDVRSPGRSAATQLPRAGRPALPRAARLRAQRDGSGSAGEHHQGQDLQLAERQLQLRGFRRDRVRRQRRLRVGEPSTLQRCRVAVLHGLDEGGLGRDPVAQRGQRRGHAPGAAAEPEGGVPASRLGRCCPRVGRCAASQSGVARHGRRGSLQALASCVEFVGGVASHPFVLRQGANRAPPQRWRRAASA
mmetsp:Transcript_129418/g.414818  ORF Transcript_129418/g.414818 Transcript_129418/m.414818 type:complete len:345 (-) Transcript_129418:1948-2982(-)